jgi:hypothetical protein
VHHDSDVGRAPVERVGLRNLLLEFALPWSTPSPFRHLAARRVNTLTKMSDEAALLRAVQSLEAKVDKQTLATEAQTRAIERQTQVIEAQAAFAKREARTRAIQAALLVPGRDFAYFVVRRSPGAKKIFFSRSRATCW